ncbi:hypothetical protein H072_198 [Dactylellina haptotyla CBS 200.50]|uniref:Fido domain-containing protein n=1 Tax=Dactylellina haptotyla (strain CBS 200.50) TaxID=1284197 RepID=S8AS31_DACHA|nr:hypothetical protein H072_198 [Dactylellina haptotyla CBS 200.50]
MVRKRKSQKSSQPVTAVKANSLPKEHTIVSRAVTSRKFSYVFLSILLSLLGVFWVFSPITLYYDISGLGVRETQVDVPRLHQQSFPDGYLDKYLQVYGKYGLNQPNVIPEFLDLALLKKRLEQDTPIVDYFTMMGEFRAPAELGREWGESFGAAGELPDYTENLRESLIGSIWVENETDFIGQQAAFLEAYNTLTNIGRLSQLAIAKVHSALYVAVSPKDEHNIPGNFRMVQAFIGNSLTANIFEIEAAIDRISEYFNNKCIQLPDRSFEYACCVLHFYKCYESIHPFTDGNGRTGRAWVNAMLMWKLLPPLFFKEEWLKNPATYHSLFEDYNGEEYLREHIQSILVNSLE